LAEPACPICGKPSLAATRPFCSRRCADVDLGRWITGQYVVPGREGEEPDHPSLDQADD
jgi:endogenous inhibitor of DNA gyrase (YacG/DUF329 family)